MVTGITKELIEWLPILWRVGVEKALELPVVHKSLALCTTHLRSLER